MPAEVFSAEDMARYYSEKLEPMGISSVTGLKDALDQGKIDLEFKAALLVSPQRQAEILEANPDEVEIGGDKYKVAYEVDYSGKRFTAGIRIPAGKVVGLKEAPVLPSGRALNLGVTGKAESDYVRFSGDDFGEVKEKTRQFLIDEQWEGWRYSQGRPQNQPLENFDPLGKEPKLPEPHPFGTDPVSGEALLAQPAIAFQRSSYSGDTYEIRYFKSREEAGASREAFVARATELRAERVRAEERERLLAPTQQGLELAETDLQKIGYDYGSYGLDYEGKHVLDESLWEARRKLQNETGAASRILEDLRKKLDQALEYKRVRDEAAEKAENFIQENMSTCPLCSVGFKEGSCSNIEGHNIDAIDFEKDGEGYERSFTVLAEIKTDSGKLVAQLRVSSGQSRRGYSRGEVYLAKGDWMPEEERWQGEAFGDLFYEIKDYKTDPLKAVQRERERLQRDYQEALEAYQDSIRRAEQKVEEGESLKGKFHLGKDPKTQKDRWEAEVRRGSVKTKYIVARFSDLPESADQIFYFFETKVLVDNPNYRVVLVKLASPLPWEKPQPPELPDLPPEPPVEPKPEGPRTPATEEQLEALRERFGGGKKRK